MSVTSATQSQTNRRTLIAAGAAFGLFAVLLVIVSAGWTDRADAAALRALRRSDQPDRTVLPRVLESAARDISGLGAWLVLVVLTLSVFAWLLSARRRAEAWIVLGAAASGWSLERIAKLLIARPRPDVVPYLDAVSTASFPSGHALMSAVVYLTVWAVLSRGLRRRADRIYTGVLAGLLVALIGLSRTVLGVHYPSDVLGGWSAGLAWMLLWRAIARRLGDRGETGPWTQG